MTGERSAIPPAVMAAVRDSGLAHLLAISGLHIGLVAGILFFGLRGALALVPPLALRYPIKKWAAAAAIPGAFAYALVAGATVPSQRAFLMIGLVLLAVLLDRRGLSMRTVAWAAVIILLLHPESLLGASFQLSFAAVTALIAGYEVVRGRRRLGGNGPPVIWRRILFYVGGVALTTLIAGAVTAPFAAYHFNRLAAYGLAANLIAVPVTALWIMPWPKRCSASGGCKAWWTANRLIADARTSIRESISDERMLIEPVSSQAAILTATRIKATATDALVARRIKGPASALVTAPGKTSSGALSVMDLLGLPTISRPSLYGNSRMVDQPSPWRMNTRRSCRRKAPWLQNSIRSGLILKPDQ